MRLLSLTVRNYRIHKEITFEFDPARTLLGGPNECGKSTLVEAIHRALFLRAKTTGGLRDEMRSSLHRGEPEVTLTFEIEATRWTLEKQFSGTKGSSLLTDGNGNAHKDDAADSKLSEILKTEFGGRANANQLAATWAHLWVWQGSSGTDPSRHASDHKDTLVQRLQQDGLAAVMQSTTDQLVRERITASYDELFTTRGPRTGSKPELARQHLAEAEIALERTQETAQRLDQAANDHQRAENELAEANALLPDLRGQKSATDAKLREVEDLRRLEETHLNQWQAAVSFRKQFAAQDTAIRALQEQAAAARNALIPAEQTEATLLAELDLTTGLNQAAEVSQRSASDAVRLAHLNNDLAAASVTSFEKAADHQRLTTLSEDASALLAEIAIHQDSLSKLPNLNSKDVEILRQLDRAASQARASLDAMATGIELLASDLDVSLDGEPFSPGDTRTLTDEGVLAIGPHTRLRIRPGGGTSLADTRLHHERSLRDFTLALDRHTLRDLDHATAVLQNRQNLAQQIAQLQTRWKALGGDGLSSSLTAATAAHETAKEEVLRRLTALDSTSSPPENIEAARQRLAAARQQLDLAGETETSTRQQSVQQRQRLDTADAAVRKHREQITEARQSLRDLDTRIQVLQETHGEADARVAVLSEAATTEQQTSTRLEATRESLKALNPDLLAADSERYARAIIQQDTRRKEAEHLQLIARERLTLDGSTDPHAELAHAQARHSSAVNLNASEQRRAQAIALLHQLFSSSREAIDRSIVQPLADRISGYLQCIFGPGTLLQVNVSDSGIEGFELLRPGDPAFNFQSLSGGTKEQVAAAVRLAMAEILAADHHGCLPIVFDDAFAFSDPDRIQTLQRMLDLAAVRGLQVIILTCTPRDYSAFGATGVSLDRPLRPEIQLRN